MTITSSHHALEDASLRFSIAPTLRFAHDEDGLVLLDLRRGDYSSFNPVGALVWKQIEMGATLEEILGTLAMTFPEVDPGIITQDVRALLTQLLNEGLIAADRSGCGARPKSSAPTRAMDSDPASANEEVGLWRTLTAFLYLVYVDVLMRLSCFRRVYDTVCETETRARSVEPASIRRTCRAMDRAARAYLKRAWCLQRSAACVFQLRRQGVPAELVLGVRTFPFGAHAWVELDGRILNDDLGHVGGFLVLDRI